ncbi:hypothetical protein [Gloeobacter kilaueensis]|uniref:Uncharacterized protein n=1 Tax=Gloeobacter kilaueensis (strain ATCC BAA-2537 / CCAP 1431/1 / ULC 316 / JS1) TaxID=1183438 RepID=U5QBS0_GLOK1|nr:hypothetical protein [Gloeobacter kilaueensis]AGY56317.1 hypothetical protein GKIL_0070 [Gloeobacter kilaueensis JS1]
MTFSLLTKQAVANFISRIITKSSSFRIYVGEDICFGDNVWVEIGKVQFFYVKHEFNNLNAVNYGGFEWSVPSTEELSANITNALNGVGKISEKERKAIEKYFGQGLQDVVRRTLLLLPTFDIGAMAKMPLLKPTTIVPDTTAVHQGALDFVAKFLMPYARVKIPAIVYMEILNNVDNFFSKLRNKEDSRGRSSYRSQALNQHILSQGGQGTLLRLESNSNVELERGDLGADPLRGIVAPSNDQEDKALGLTGIVKSFGDRLIVETARRFQLQVRPSHPLVLLTSDQGMARMAISEGIEVFYFQARSTSGFSGKTLTGVLHHPFNGGLYFVPFTDVLWELAITFGCLRLSNEDGDSVELRAIGASGTIDWQPYYTQRDLLFGRFGESSLGKSSDLEDSSEITHIETISPITKTGVQFTNKEDNTSAEHTQTNIDKTLQNLTGSYSFSPSKMLILMRELIEHGSVANNEIIELLDIKTRDQATRYKNFLLSGNLITTDGKSLFCTLSLQELWNCVTTQNILCVRNCLIDVPSFSTFVNHLNERRVLQTIPNDWPVSSSALRTYLMLGDIAGCSLSIPNIGVVATDSVFNTSDFANRAIKVYQSISSQVESTWILSGRWLEELARDCALHPVFSRENLLKAIDKNLLSVYAEGSTPDTRFEKHHMWALQVVDGRPQIEKIFLYRGDFLLPGTAAVRIRIEGVNHAT